ncbi:glycerophosphodiester phosphodiesterase [Candidatus Saccharibacteria bacterium]|nr:MAG: glycerophosphodiester phosphodiesterase [Candidatus Saccharibacteria bacterium]
MKIIAHRGAKGLAPENTLDAIQAGVNAGADEIEIDVRVTGDAVPILSHDPTLLIDGKPTAIALLTLDDIWKAHPDIPTLAEALELIHPRSVAHLEVKKNEPVEPIAEVIRECLTSGTYSLDSIILASKSQKILRALQRELPDIQLVVIESWSGVRARRRAKQVRTKRLSMRASWLWNGFLGGMYRHGYQITPYTMNDPKKVRKWQQYLYGIVTDYPDRFTR